MFPEELLQVVVEQLAYNPSFLERQTAKFRWKFAQNELAPLSMANHQWRRLCMPFLFAYVNIRAGELERFAVECMNSSCFAASIRTLHLEIDFSSDMIIPLLPHLTNLHQIILADNIDLPLLNAVNRHPLATVLLHTDSTEPLIPSQSGPSDLVKVALELSSHASAEENVGIQAYLSRGMKVTWMSLYSLMLPVNNLLVTQTYNGLRELELQLFRDSDLSWLPQFTRAHPLLKNIVFIFVMPSVFMTAVPSMAQYTNELQGQSLHTISTLRYAISCASPGSTAATDRFGDWHVSWIDIQFFREIPGPILDITQSSFPHLSNRTIRLMPTKSSATFAVLFTPTSEPDGCSLPIDILVSWE